jgi:hypothetical protein
VHSSGYVPLASGYVPLAPSAPSSDSAEGNHAMQCAQTCKVLSGSPLGLISERDTANTPSARCKAGLTGRSIVIPGHHSAGTATFRGSNW